MIQNSPFLPNLASYARVQPSDLPISSDMLWIIIKNNFTQVTWLKAIYNKECVPTESEIEQQRKTFIQKLVEMVRKSSKSSIGSVSTDVIEERKTSAKMNTDSCTNQKT